MFSWFKKKPDTETSPGGSVVYRHEGDVFSKSQVGFTPESTAGFGKAREKIYERYFGKSLTLFHELISLVPHIDVYTYEPGHDGRNFFTLVTSGLSDLEMTVPPDRAAAPNRVERIFYCLEPKPEYLETLRSLAHFPHDNKTWLGPGHTIPNRNPPEPFFGSAVLDTVLFMPTIVPLTAGSPPNSNL